MPSVRRKHATASLRLQPNAWAAEDLLPEGLGLGVQGSNGSSVTAATTRPCSLSSAGGDSGDQPSALSEGGLSSVEEGEMEGESEKCP